MSCQEKVTKKKARPVWRPCGVPCATRPGRGLRNSPSAQTVLALFRPSLRAPQEALLGCCSAPHRARNTKPAAADTASGSVRLVLTLTPFGAAEQRRRAGGSRRALFEPKASCAAARSVEQRRELLWGFIPKERRRGVAFFLVTFSWRRKKK